MDLNFDGPILHQFFKTRFQSGFYKIILTAQTGVQTVIDALVISSDLHVERGTQAGKLQVIDNANRARALLVGLLQDDGAFLAQGKTEGRILVALKRRSGGPEDLLHSIECSRLRGSRGSPA